MTHLSRKKKSNLLIPLINVLKEIKLSLEYLIMLHLTKLNLLKSKSKSLFLMIQLEFKIEVLKIIWEEILIYQQ